MQPLRRLLSFGHRNPIVWSRSREISALGPAPLRRIAPVVDAIPPKPVFTRYGVPNVCIKHNNAIMQSHASKWCAKLIVHGKWIHNLCPSGRNLCVGSFLGISAIAGAMNLSPNVAYAMNGHVEEHLSDSGDPADFLKQDLDTVWELTKKFQLPAVLLLTVLFGWRHPIVLAINVALLLFCTRPNPFSIYIFIEELRRRAMRQNPGLYKTKGLMIMDLKKQRNWWGHHRVHHWAPYSEPRPHCPDCTEPLARRLARRPGVLIILCKESGGSRLQASVLCKC